MHSQKYITPKARRISLLLSTGLMAAWLLTACGGGSDPTAVPPTDTPAAVATNTPEPVPTDTPAAAAEPTVAPETQAVTGTQSMTGTGAVTGTDSVTGTGNVTATAGTTTTAPLTGADTQLEAVTINLHEDAKLGSILVDQGGMTLYLFDKDDAGKSNCTGDCLVKWPPLVVGNADEVSVGEGVTGTVDTLELADGTYQVLYAGHPLYYYAEDTQPGETTGQAVGEVWWVVNAAGSAVHTQ